MLYFVMVEIGYDMEHTHPSYTFMEHENTRHATGHKNAFRCTNLISTFEILHLNEHFNLPLQSGFSKNEPVKFIDKAQKQPSGLQLYWIFRKSFFTEDLRATAP